MNKLKMDGQLCITYTLHYSYSVFHRPSRVLFFLSQDLSLSIRDWVQFKISVIPFWLPISIDWSRMKLFEWRQMKLYFVANMVTLQFKISTEVKVKRKKHIQLLEYAINFIIIRSGGSIIGVLWIYFVKSRILKR